MWRRSTVTLIQPNPIPHGAGEDVNERRHTVPCSVKSVGQKEHYLAKGFGLKPEVKLVLDNAHNYHGEKQCCFEGERYEIERSYDPETNETELILYPDSRAAHGTAQTGGVRDA